MKRIKFYVCPSCGSLIEGVGNSQIICCGKQLAPLKSNPADSGHSLNISETEGDYFIEINHEMTKEHYISFISYVRYDRVLTVKLYPEQDCFVRFPKMYGGKFYYYCSKHGLFEYKSK